MTTRNTNGYKPGSNAGTGSAIPIRTARRIPAPGRVRIPIQALETLELPLPKEGDPRGGRGGAHGGQPIRALIVGAGAVGRALAASLDADDRYELIGFVDDYLDPEVREDWPILGGRDATLAIAQHYGIDEIFVAYAPTWQQCLAEDLAMVHPQVRVRVVPSFYEAMMRSGSVESMGDIALVRLTAGAGRSSGLLKHLLDVTVALGALIVLAPLLGFVAILIKMTSLGPVIFAQERTGRYGKPFVLYKFRTMLPDAEAATGPVLSSGKNDPRLTPVGRWLRLFRIDELPQLWNVLRGQMSLVGPRPERPSFVRKYQDRNPMYAKRHEVRPGITGLAQVLGGYHTDPRDKLRFDLFYVSHQSLWLDLSVLLRTVLVVCCPRGR